MARTSKRQLLAALAIVFLCSNNHAALATRLPKPLSSAITHEFADAKVRLDGSFETKGELYLPVVFPGSAPPPEKITLETSYPNAERPDMLLFSNGWCYLRLIKTGVTNTVISANILPEKLKRVLLKGKLPADLIVPDVIMFPSSLKGLIGELSISTYDESLAARTAAGDHSKTEKKVEQTVPGKPVVTTSAGTTKASANSKANEKGEIFVTAPKTGNLVELDDKSFAKLAEYPTEGTPAGLACAHGKLYVADQGKGRILKFNVKKKRFEGAIVLAPRSAPKGLALLPNGKLLYVCESGANDIAVIETETDRVLLRTHTPSGPARISMTPDGFHVVVLNTHSGEATIISTLNQRVIGTVVVGSMPNDCVISEDSLHAYISNRMSNTVSVVDISTKHVVGTIKTGTAPTGLALSQDGTKLYVASAKDNTIDVYDTKTRQSINQVKLPLDVDFPGAIEIMPDGKHMIVSSESTEAVGILNLEDLQFSGQPVIGQTSDEIIWVSIE